MMYFSSNIKFLRKRYRKTQAELASILGFSRSTLNNYENNIAEPGLPVLIGLADYFHIAVDTLLRIDLSSLRDSQLYELERGQDVFLRGTDIRVLATTVNSKNRDNIELVSEKAKAGYLNGFADPEYISGLPVFSLPFLSNEKKYRTFQINGDSMLPIPDKAWIVGEFVQDWTAIRSGGYYVILTLNEGIVFKKVNRFEEACYIEMVSTNKSYIPYNLSFVEIREVWQFICYITSDIPEADVITHLAGQIEGIKKELNSINKKL